MVAVVQPTNTWDPDYLAASRRFNGSAQRGILAQGEMCARVVVVADAITRWRPFECSS